MDSVVPTRPASQGLVATAPVRNLPGKTAAIVVKKKGTSHRPTLLDCANRIRRSRSDPPSLEQLLSFDLPEIGSFCRSSAAPSSPPSEIIVAQPNIPSGSPFVIVSISALVKQFATVQTIIIVC